ncbi:Phage tail sheath protein [Brevinema andersonii]|uniref:Phage tail sheath protein n=1 Tax=Brevinema andersonii TaxID=34097 RepID=A0A1I1EU22_BREAD|nr:DUF2586 domain-containing protein [Brevinema andersonii]SFB88403.1 Phage tail sheath protein [Brevinema andersonii]
MWSSVEEKITDGVSGLSPNTQPVAVLVGTCSKGTVNFPISLGKTSQTEEVLGYGNLPRRLTEMQENMADVSIIAVPSKADQAGSIGSVKKKGSGNLTVSGSPLCSALVNVVTVTPGQAGTAEVWIEIFGDCNKEETVLVPTNRTIFSKELGISILFPEGTLTLENSWSFSITAPASTFNSLKAALDTALELYHPEFVFVCQELGAEDVKKWEAYTEKLFSDQHQPLFALLETGLDSTKSLSEAISQKVKEFKKIDARFVSVVCQPLQNYQSAAALCAGTLTKASVNQSIGATKHFGLSHIQLPKDWTNHQSRTLDEARLITLRTYPGLNGYFWTNGRTLASDTSDYRFIEVVRTVFKAIRLARRASLPYIQAPGDKSGLESLLAEVRMALTVMTAANPKEIEDFVVEMPKGQDIVNNGVQINIALYGIPIIRKIVLNFMFKYHQRRED